MKTQANPDIYWKIRELAVTARTTVKELLKEARISSATVHAWGAGGVQPRAKTVQRLNAAAERLRERAMQ